MVVYRTPTIFAINFRQLMLFVNSAGYNSTAAVWVLTLYPAIARASRGRRVCYNK